MKTLNKKDIDLLKNLCLIQSSRSSDSEINEFIKKEIGKIDGVVISEDAFGNVYAKKGSGENGYKAIVSHTDTVHLHQAERAVVEVYGSLLAFAKKKTIGYESTTVEQVGIGGDDKAGVFKCIKALQDFDNIKAAFFRFEESGCLGSREADMKFFEDCNFVLQSDRRGNSDFITFTNGVKTSSVEFDKAMEPTLTKFGFKSEFGSSTDVGQLKHNGLKVSCANISSGYYAAHTSSETINLEDLTKTYSLICEIFDNHGETRFSHEKAAPVASQTSFDFYQGLISKKFSFSMDKNYFSGPMMKPTTQYQLMRIAGTQAYKLILDNTIPMHDHKCLTCSEKGFTTFFPEDGVFYCDSPIHSEIIEDWGLFEDLKINVDDIDYVYDRASDVWYKEKDSVYYNMEDRYLLREQMAY